MEDHAGWVSGSLLTFLDPDELPILLTGGITRSFPGGDLLLREGDPTNHVFVIVAGWVRVYSTSLDGREVLLGLRGPGDVIGDLAALHGWSRTASVRTLDGVTAVQLLSAQFVHNLQTRPRIALAMLKQMSTRLRESEITRIDFGTFDVTKRVARYILWLIERHGVSEAGGLSLRMPLTQQDIANRVGASRRAVARAMRVLRERRIVATSRQRILVARPDVLALFGNASAGDIASW
jgi:CRP/FNR family cyclic AMP-dependent transcriptional regulator